MSRAIDLLHLGRDRVICAYELEGVIVDPGPGSTLETLLGALDPVEPRAVLLTHIHLDHAGATGGLAERFPELEVYVHERGAEHMVDPTALLKSAQRLYGEDMYELWGETKPVPREQVHALSGGESLLGFRVEYTPGHASHHVSYLHEDTGEAFVGDVTGVRVPPFEHTLAPTPPPDVDVEAWLDSLHKVAAWSPLTLCLTHFGPVTDVDEQLHRIRTALLDQAELAREGNEEEFVRTLDRGLREAADEDGAASYAQAAPLDQLWQGLERYWRKRAEEAA